MGEEALEVLNSRSKYSNKIIRGRIAAAILTDMQSLDTTRELRSLDLLAEIGTPEALEHLRKIASGGQQTTLGRAAQVALQGA